MKPAPFERHVPQTIDEAVAALARYAPDDGRIVAGGQSLVPIMAFRMARPNHLIDINEIDDLKLIAVIDGALSIGACVRHAAFQTPVVDGPLGPSVVFCDAAHCTLSDPDARHVLRQPRTTPIRPRNGALSRRRWMRRSSREERAR